MLFDQLPGRYDKSAIDSTTSGLYAKLGGRSTVYRARMIGLALFTVLSLAIWVLHNWAWDLRGRNHGLQWTQSGGSFSSTDGPDTLPKNTSPITKPNRIVVMPTNAAAPDFCRALFTLLINGYPTPVVVGWNVNMQHWYLELVVESLNKWINNDDGNDSDIILIIDARDVYAQLPADTFFSQFEAQHPAPDIIVGAEKNCCPGPRNAARCTNLPESPLAGDVYGDLTDRDQPHHTSNFTPGAMAGDPSSWEYARLETRRPTYINSGTIVGRRADLKRVSDSMTAYGRLALSGGILVQQLGNAQELLQIANLGHLLTKGVGLVIPDMLAKFFQVVTLAYKDLEIHALGEILGNVSNTQQESLHQTLAENEEWRHRSVIWNRISRTVPFFLHFPGIKPPAKTDPYYTNLWFMRVDEKLNGTRPADRFLRHIEANAEEHFGYGVRLDDGQWMGFMDMCSTHTSKILATDDSWIKNPGGPYDEYGDP